MQGAKCVALARALVPRVPDARRARRPCLSRRYRQDVTHPGAPTMGAPARWSSLKVDSDDEGATEGHSSAAEESKPRQERKPREAEAGLPLVDLTAEEVFVLEPHLERS